MRWSALASRLPIDSPYFQPEFTEAVAAVRDDVEVAVLDHGSQTVGFFPFQRGRMNVGMPVGGKLSDFQAVIAEPDSGWNAAELVRGCRLASWQFDHLLAEQPSFLPYHNGVEPSPYIDLSCGLETYYARRRELGSELISQIQRKARKIQREVGPLRFVLHEPTASALQMLFHWKKEQHSETGVVDIFQYGWVVALLDRIRETQSPGFSGVLSTLYAGDELVAVHLGMRTRTVLHWWFPTYNREFSKYSPGLILLLHLAQAAASEGVQRIDLGKGPERYKYSLNSGSIAVAHGAVDCNVWLRGARTGWRTAKTWIKKSPLRGPARAPGRMLHNLRQRLLFQ